MARPTRESQKIEEAARGRAAKPDPRDFGPEDDGEQAPQDDPLTPGDGVPRTPIEVRLTDSELKALADEFCSEIEYQYAAQSTLRYDMQRWIKIYRARPAFDRKDYPLAHASNVVVPLAAIYTDQVVARIVQAIFSPKPFWIVQEQQKRFAEAAKPYERYLDWACQNVWDQYRVVKPFVQDVVKLGTGIIYNDWTVETLFRYDDSTRRTIETGTRIGPRPRWIPREDVIVPFGFANMQQAPWCGHRVWFSWDSLERLAHQGLIENLDALRGHSDDEDEVKLERRRNHEPMVDQSADDRFGLWSPWYIWFRRDLDQDGWPEEYVGLFHVETRTILRLVANPSPTGMRPYVSSRFIEVEGEFDGIGIPEQVDSLQEESSTIHNQRRDRAHLANIVMYKARSAVSNIGETIRPESGKVIKLTQPDDLQEFHPSSAVTEGVFEEGSVTKLAELRVGMSDISMGKESSPIGRAAATTVMALMQEGSRRFDLNVSDIRSALTEQGHQITEMWQIYGLPKPEEGGAPEQVLDDKDAQMVRQLLETPVSLRGLVSIQLNIATAAVNREVEKQSNIQLFGIVQGYMNQVIGQIAPMFLNPALPEQMKQLLLHGVQGLDKCLLAIFQAHNKFDLESVLAGEMLAELSQVPPQQLLQQQMQQAQISQMVGQAGGGQQPPAGAHPAGHPPNPRQAGGAPKPNGGAPPGGMVPGAGPH